MSEQKEPVGGGWDKATELLGKAKEAAATGAKKAAEAAQTGARKAKEAAQAGAEKAQQAMDDMDKRREEAKASKVAADGWDGATEMGAYAAQSGAPVSQNKILADPTEQITATIGNNYIQSFLTGAGVKRGCGILTNRRFYYKGKNFSTDQEGKGIINFFKSLTSTTEEGTVSVDDISFTKFSYTRNTGLLILAILCLIVGVGLFFARIEEAGSALGVAAIVFFVMYFLKRSVIFEIYFPGGSFGYNLRWYPISEFRDFQRQVHLTKDHRKEGAAV